MFITVENDVIIKSPRRSVKTVWPCFFFDVLIGPVESETLKLCQFSYRSLPQKTNARNVSSRTLYGGQFTLSTQLIKLKVIYGHVCLRGR